ncbi:MAG: ABC transporter ATP-binding protein, partial [Cyanobacteria bacterium J06641_5]
SKALIGVAPQENLLYKSLTCAENLDFFAQLYGLDRTTRQRQVRACLAAVALSDRANAPVAELSGGMQRRLNIAVALVHQPKLLILDEPTVGLDLEARTKLWELLRALRQQGTTILLATHLLTEAEQLCDRLCILQAGRCLAMGSFTELRDRFVPACELAIVQTEEPQKAIARAVALGYPYRRQQHDLVFWLPESLELSELLAKFSEIALTSVARQPVRLEQIYQEALAHTVSQLPVETVEN